MDTSGAINDLGKQYIGKMAASANPTQPANTSSGSMVKVNGGYLSGAPATAATLFAGILAGVALNLA
jgi:hypothetical protein